MQARLRRRVLGGLATLSMALATALALGGGALPAQADPDGAQADPVKMPGAPYLYLGWGDPPSPTSVMSETGVRAFTMAFILSSGGCDPAWDGSRPLSGGVDERTINEIKAAGGEVQISFGGWSGNKLGPNCSSPEAYAGAVQQVIDAHQPNVVDFDIENSDEFEDYAVQDRILRGLVIVGQNNPDVRIAVTIGTGQSGPTGAGTRLIDRAAELGVPIDNYTIMPFNFDSSDIVRSTIDASEGLRGQLSSAHGWSDSEAYAHMGISGMNGLSDQSEVTTTEDWTQIRDYAQDKGLTRLAFWAVNRDRECAGDLTDTCSGVPQQQFEFTRITGGF